MIDTLRAGIGAAGGTARALAALTRSGVVRPVRPDRLAGMACGLLRYGIGLAAGYTAGAARHPRRAAIVDDAGAVSYAELHWRTDRLARALAARGTGPDEPVALLCRNSRHPVEVAVAAEKIGADVVLLNNGMAPAQLADVLADLGVHTVVADADLHDRLAALPEDVGVVVARGPGDGHPTCEDLIAADVAGTLPLRPGRSRTVVLTSGTSGPPKGARRPHPSTLAPAAAILSEIRCARASACTSPRRCSTPGATRRCCWPSCTARPSCCGPGSTRRTSSTPLRRTGATPCSRCR
ncbi:AMP-binding protein [Pseudonocardia benzenivorans]